MTAITIHVDDKQAEALRNEAQRQNISVEEFLKQQAERAVKTSANVRKKKDTLSRALGLAKTDKPSPNDVEAKQILIDERIRKHG